MSIEQVKQTPITYIASIAAGFPVYGSTVANINYLGMNANMVLLNPPGGLADAWVAGIYD